MRWLSEWNQVGWTRVRSIRGPSLPTVILHVPADEYKHAEEKYVLRMMEAKCKGRDYCCSACETESGPLDVGWGNPPIDH